MAYHVEKEGNNGGLAEIIRVLFMGSSCTVYQADQLEERQAAEGYNYDSFYQMICNYIYYYIFWWSYFNRIIIDLIPLAEWSYVVTIHITESSLKYHLVLSNHSYSFSKWSCQHTACFLKVLDEVKYTELVRLVSCLLIMACQTQEQTHECRGCCDHMKPLKGW